MSLPDLTRYPVVCIDVETTGTSWLHDRVFGVAVAVPLCSVEQLVADPVGAPVSAIYFDVRRQPHLYADLRNQAPNIRLMVNQNAKFDLHMLANDKVLLDPRRVECTMIRASLIDEHRFKYDLDSLAREYMGIGKVDDIYERLAELFGGRATRAVQMKNLHRAPVSEVAPYARRDAEVALRLWAWQQQEIERQELGMVWDLERRLFPHIFRMERNGIRVDEAEAERQVERLTKAIDTGQKELDALAGFPVNPNPSGSIHRLFAPKQGEDGHWRACDGTLLTLTPAGKPSLGIDALERIEHPAAAAVIRLRKMLKTRDTFITGHILGHAVNGRVHPNINQVKGDETGGTGTGRLSYTRPALQQIPNRDRDTAAMVRPIFLPELGAGWSYGDLDQHELRIFHHYVNNPEIVRSYQENPNLDGHAVVAELSGLPRNPPRSGGPNAKQLGLGAVFNMGMGEMASRMGLPYSMDSFIDKRGQVHEFKRAGAEAMEVIDHFYKVVPGIREIAGKATAIAKSRGYVRSMFGRHIRFPRGEFVHKASGLVYQSSSADLVKLDIINVCEYLESESPDGRLLLSIHDEFSISMPDDDRAKGHMDEIQNLIQTRPGSPVRLRIPVRLDFSKLSANWWDATNAEKIHSTLDK